MADPKRQLIWSPEALADLSEIWEYYADAAGPSVSDNIIRNIEKVCRIIQDHPLAGDSRRAAVRSEIADGDATCRLLSRYQQRT
jgi:plasmid stabilization system protein ParE